MTQYLALKASAGSGKTFALSVRYISLLFLDINPSSILTLTFTNKAALEMSERIFKTLIKLGEDEIILNEIIKNTKLTKEEILDKKEAVLNRYLQSDLSILTLDKFMNKILREFSGYLGLGEDFSIINNDHDFLLFKFLTSLDDKYFEYFISFIDIHNTNLKSVIDLFSVLDEKNESYEYFEFKREVLELFKVKILELANEIKERVLELGLSKSAINAVDFTNIKELLTKTWLQKDSLLEYSYFKKAKEKIGVLDGTLHELKKQIDYYINYEEQGKLNNLYTIYNHFREFRLKYKKEKNQLKFSDVTNLVYTLLEHHIDKDFLYFRLDNKFDHIMIDEFQDTSVLQFKILKPLIDEIFSGSVESYKTFFYVGDTKQSIYRFRGGKKELFDYVYETYNEELVLDSLNTNYRSAKNIVRFTNSIFMEQINYEYEEQLVFSKDEGYVEVHKFDIDENEPYKDVKTKLEELLSYNIDPNTIAILTYTNDDVLGVYKYLKQEFPKLNIVTDMTSKIINQANVKALINGVKYLYFKESIYLTTFNSLLGYPLIQEFTFQTDIKTTSLLDIVYTMATDYQLIDSNVIKFLDIIDSYEDLVEFIYEIDNEESSMISTQTQGVQILTIFKSKGLEYENVILLDRIKNQVADRAKLLFSYDVVKLNRVFFKDKNRIHFDANYAQAIEKESAQKLDDNLNILYVAITRAKENLIILKKEEKSVFDIFTKKIDDYKIGKIDTKPLNNSVLDEENIISYTPLSLGTQEVDKKTVLENSDNLKARYFGLATHYCLEMMNSFSKDSLENAIILTQSKYNGYLDENEMNDIYQRIDNLIENTSFQKLITNNEIYKEQELVYNKELKIIDLLIKTDDGFVVIDYKTTLSKSDTHFEQVIKYKEAISQITDETVSGYLIYMKKDSVEVCEVK
jgi:exodeoxyribonuclease V beta subunit